MPLKLKTRLANVFRRFNNTRFVNKNATINPLLASTMSGQAISSPISFFQNEAAYRAVAIVSSCIDQVAKDFQQLPFIINRVTIKNNVEERENITLESRFNPFRRPNETQTAASYRRKIIQQRNIIGENYIEPVMGISSEPPKEFHLLNPINFEVVLNTKGIDKYIERINSAEKIWSPNVADDNYLIYFCVEDPFNELRGVSPLDFLKSETSLDWHLLRFALSFLKNGARFSNLVSFTEDIGKDELDLAKKDFEKKFAGSSDAFQTLFLDNGATITEMGTSQSDMMFIQQLDKVESMIAGRFNMPPFLVGLAEKTSLGNDVIDAQMTLYWSTTMISEGALFDDMYNHFKMPLFAKPGEVLEYVTDFSKVTYLQKDKNIEHKRHREDFGSGGSTLGELVEKLGNKTIEDENISNIRVLPFNLGLVSDLLFSPEPTPETAIPDEEKGLKSITIDLNNVVLAPLTNKAGRESLLKNKVRTAKFRRISKEREKVEKIFNIAYTKIADVQLKSIETKLSLLDTKDFSNLDVKAELDPDDINKLLIKIPVGVQQLKRGFEPANLESIATAEKIVARETGLKLIEVTVTDDVTKKLIKAREILYPNIIITTNNLISKVLENGIADNLDIADISKNIQTLFNGQIKVSRADLIARTESVGLTNMSQLESMRQGGIKKKMWLTSRDDDVRESHIILDGETVGIDETFSNGSQVPDDFNERCTTLPVK